MIAKPTAFFAASGGVYKRQIRAAAKTATELLAGRVVRLELVFVVDLVGTGGTSGSQTIDALDPLSGHSG